MSISTRLAAEGFDPAQELSQFLSTIDDEGGIVSFIGVARPRTRAGSKVERLLLDHHPRLTARSMQEIAETARSCFSVTALRIVHRIGFVEAGEPIVFVAAASAHRRAAFDGADYAMDRLKTDAVFWKREDAVDGSRWIEPSGADHEARARWSD